MSRLEGRQAGNVLLNCLVKFPARRLKDWFMPKEQGPVGLSATTHGLLEIRRVRGV
jgi:hypothetical protein